MEQMKPSREPSHQALILGMLAVMALVAGGVLWVSSPTQTLLGQSAYGIRSAFHGLFAGMFMVTVTIGLYQAFRLWTRAPLAVHEMEAGSLVNVAACFLTIVFGNWLYIPYRATGGSRSYFLATAPEVHKIFFEFKEFTALFTLPLSVAAAFVICRYGERLASSKRVRETVALLLVLTFFYFVIAFGLGAAVTKLKSV